MKTKKLLLALPLVSVLASCTAKIVVYDDFFKAARNLSTETKEEARAALKNWSYMGTRTITSYYDNTEVGTKSQDVYASVSHDEDELIGKIYSAVYSVDSVQKVNIVYNNETESFDATELPPNSNAETLYYNFLNVVFSWGASMETADFDVLPYGYNTKLLDNCYRPLYTVGGQKTNAENFEVKMNGAGTYHAGELDISASGYHAVYQNYRLQQFTCTYKYALSNVGMTAIVSISGTFSYNIH